MVTIFLSVTPCSILIFTAILGFGFSFGLTGVFTYPLSERPDKAAGITAAATLFQFGFSGIFILVTTQLSDALGGAGGYMTLLAGVLFLTLVPVTVLVVRGWRKSRNTETELPKVDV